MKPDKNKLDEYLRQKVDQASFPYKEEYWQKMSAILDERDKKKNPFFRRGLYILLGLIVIGGVALYLSTSRQGQPGSPVPSAGKPISKQQQTVPPSLSQENDALGENQAEEKNQMVPGANKPSKLASVVESSSSNGVQATPEKATRPNDQPDRENSPVPAQNTGDQPANNPEQVQEVTASVTDERQPQAEKTRKVNQQHRSKRYKADALAEGEGIAKEQAAGSERPKRSARKRVNAAPGQGGATATSIWNNDPAKAGDQEPITTKNGEIKPAIAIAANQGKSILVAGKEMRGTDTSRYTRAMLQDPVKTNPRYVPNLVDYIPVRLDSVTVITLKQAGSLPALVNPPVETARTADEPKEKFKPLPYEFFLLAGLNMNKGWNGNVARPASWAYSPYIGFGAGRQIAPRLTLTMNAGFTWFNGLNTTSSVSSYQYSFGVDSTTFTVAYKKLLQLYLPFSVYYKLAGNHFLMMALGANWTMDVSSKVTETRSVNTGFPGNATRQPVSSSSSQTGYRSGFNPFDVYAQIGYCYRFQQRYMLQLSVQQGFFDMTKNSFFGNNLRNTQSRISLGLKYTLH